MIRKKIRSNKGETLVEALCTLLVVLLSVTLFATFISAAAKLNSTAASNEAALFDTLFEFETATDAPLGSPTEELTVTVGVGSQIYTVELMKRNGLTVYRPSRGGGS